MYRPHFAKILNMVGIKPKDQIEYISSLIIRDGNNQRIVGLEHLLQNKFLFYIHHAANEEFMGMVWAESKKATQLDQEDQMKILIVVRETIKYFKRIK